MGGYGGSGVLLWILARGDGGMPGRPIGENPSRFDKLERTWYIFFVDSRIALPTRPCSLTTCV